MDPIRDVYVKLLAADLSTLTVQPSRPRLFSRNGRPVTCAETVGVVVTHDRRAKYLRFHVDDGSGCIPCIIWHNNASLPDNAASAAASDAAMRYAETVRLGELVRVRGKITAYMGTVQITVRDVVVERDPNMEVLHWLDCIRLARQCYDAPR